MKMTTNRKLTLLALAETGDDLPPYAASSIAYMMTNAFNYKWPRYEELKSIPNKQQIHRTLRDLWRDGLIVGTRFKEDAPYGGGLPSWVIRYQLSSEVEFNFMAATCNALHRKVDKAKHGVNFFGSVMDMGLPPDEVAALTVEVKRILQKTHPDKVPGMGDQFKQMIQCRDWIKSGIPLSAPTHSTEQHQPKISRLKNG
ncbi:hypothetical protein [Methylobacter tundripaludum]|nr:hypothetical protein [Methylobacter tundripaludum]